MKKFCLHIITSFVSFLFLSTIYSQPNTSGLLKKEEVITYWNKEKTQLRSVGSYKTHGASRIGEKTGDWKFYYPNGELQEISEYFEGKLNGEYRSFYASGKLKIKGYFTLGLPDSTFEAFYFNGKLAEKGSYKTVPYINIKDTVQLLKNIEKTDAIKSIKTNNWTYYYMNGKIMEETLFKDIDTNEYIINYYDTSGNIIVKNGSGKLKTHYPSGKVKTEETIHKGMKNGVSILYKPSGEIRRKGHYKNGKMDSIWEETYITKAQVYQIKGYKEGVKNGPFKEFTIDGKPNIIGHYLNDKKDGDWTYYYINNKVDMQGAFKNDEQHGYWTYYYPKGQVYYEGNYVNGQKDGDWKFYYNNGNTWREGTYKLDQKNGLWTTLYESGQKSMEGSFKNNLENELWHSWYENGQLKDKGYFNKGKMNSHWDGYYTNGQMKYSGDYDNDYKINKWTYWSVKGKIIEIRNYKLIEKKSGLIPDENRIVKKSVNHGEWVKYSEIDESIVSIEKYSEGKLDGDSKYYFPGGVIENRIVAYKNGLLNGVYKSFDRKGNLTTETHYKDNKKHGDMKIYSRRGKLISHVTYKDGVKTKDVLKKVTFKYPSPKKKK